MAKIYDEEGVPVKCPRCHKNIDTKMELEYSDILNTVCCSPDCATNIYYEYLRSSPLEGNKLKEVFTNKKWVIK